jgi:AmiR/NasT family two-component response regulator
VNGEQLIDFCRFYRPDLVITDIKMPDMDGIEAATKLYEEMPLPVILVSAYSDAKLIERAEADHIMAYLVKPIKQTDLEPAIGLAMRRFEQFEALRREASDMRQALENRKIIERAKGILMKELSLDEAEAFRRLQRGAMNRQTTMVEMARWVLATSQAGHLS